MRYVLTGFPRAGTTMLYNMFRYACPDLHYYDRETSIRNANKRLVMTKRPKDVFECVKYSESPENRFIVLIRDPRDVLTSKHANSQGLFKVSWDHSVKTNSSQGVVGKTNGLQDYYKGICDVTNPVMIRYEDLVTDTDAIQKMLEKELSLNFEKDFKDFWKQAPPKRLTHQLNGLRPPDTNAIGRYKNFRSRIKSQIQDFPEILDVLIELGYEQNKDWFDDF